jgi:peptide/nickel transport system permease protein
MAETVQSLTKTPATALPQPPSSTVPFRRLRGRKRTGLWLGLALLAPILVAALTAPQIAPAGPFVSSGPPFQPPSGQHLLGTDDLGRDLLVGVIYGARTSLFVGLSVACLALLLGTLVGLVAGFAGGWSDDGLMRLTELFQILPHFFLAVAVVALFGSNLWNLILVLALTSWSGLARIARAEVLSLRERDFVLGARAVGVRPAGILWRHILPNASRPLLASAALIVSSAILTEAGLSFLGLGDPNTISWGYLLNNAQPFIRRAWWLPVFPGLALAVTILGLSLILEELSG